MKLQDLIELFLDDDHTGRGSHQPVVEAHRDNSSLADIVRILRELDGQHATDRESS